MHQNNDLRGYLLLFSSWLSTIVASISIETVPIICSCVVSVLAGINYWYQIKNNRNKSKKKDSEE